MLDEVPLLHNGRQLFGDCDPPISVAKDAADMGHQRSFNSLFGCRPALEADELRPGSSTGTLSQSLAGSCPRIVDIDQRPGSAGQIVVKLPLLIDHELACRIQEP